MTLAELITIIRNRLNTLDQQRGQAVSAGDLARVTAIDADMAETQATLDALNTLV
jgi:hypothetical protein